jgi:hypothetical protein
MLLFRGVFGLLFVFVWIFCMIDVITTPKEQIRNLPKLVWVFIVILLPDVGSIAWLIAGRNWEKAAARAAQPRTSPGASRWASPRASGRASGGASNPDDDEEFLASLRARAEEQRRRAREAQQPDKPDDGT